VEGEWRGKVIRRRRKGRGKRRKGEGKGREGEKGGREGPPHCFLDKSNPDRNRETVGVVNTKCFKMGLTSSVR